MLKVKFNVGEKVFAKMKGYCAWPAKIEGIADFTEHRVKYHVYFYGSNQTAVCREGVIFSYNENKHKYGKPKKVKNFNIAIKELEADTDNVLKTTIIDPLKSNKLLDALRIESRLLKILYEIQINLTAEQAMNTQLCQQYLDEIYYLKLTPLMVKKHAEVIIFLENLQNYIGNTDLWNMSEIDKLSFDNQAAIIRFKAKVAYDKIRSLFDVPYLITFNDFFNEEMVKFINDTKCLSKDDYFCLI